MQQREEWVLWVGLVLGAVAFSVVLRVIGFGWHVSIMFGVLLAWALLLLLSLILDVKWENRMRSELKLRGKDD